MAAAEAVPPVTPGWQSSEFWLTVLANLVALVGQMQGSIPEPWGYAAATALTAVYAITRAFVKGTTVKARTQLALAHK